MLLAVAIIGIITFVICLIGVYIGKKFGEIFSSKAEVIGGIVLIVIGAKIFAEHMF
jgi:putative Mn2+ efflux pump MntP